MFQHIKECVVRITDWMSKDLVQARMTDDGKRPWFIRPEDTADFKRESLRKYTDRTDINQEFKERFRVKDAPSRKGISALQVEVGMLYGITNCVVQRYRGRLHYYRADLTQKAARIPAAAGQALNHFRQFKKNLDN